MRRVLAAAGACAGLALPMMAAAQSAAMTGATPGHSMMNAGTSVMSEDRALPGAQAPLSEGEVRKVDSATGRLTLRHGPLANLDMPAMTMVFRVRDPAWLSQVKVGDKVHFVAQRVDGNLTVTSFAPQEP